MKKFLHAAVLLSALLPLCIASRPAHAARSNIVSLDDFGDLSGWTITGAKEVKVVNDPVDGKYLLWHSTSRNGTTMVKDLTAIKDKLAGCDAIEFEYYMDGDPSSGYMNIENIPGYPSAREWYFKFSYNHLHEWHTARFQLALDDDSPDNGKDPRTLLSMSFGGWMASANPSYGWRIKNLRAVNYPVTVDYDETARNFQASGNSYSYRYDLKVANHDATDHQCSLLFDRASLKHFTVTAPAAPFTVKAGQTLIVPAIVSIPIHTAEGLRPLYTEPIPFVLHVAGLDAPDTTVLRGWTQLPLFGTVPPRYGRVDRPRVYCNADRLGQLRQWVTEDGDFKKTLDDLERREADMLTRPVVVPAFAGIYDQDAYICPVCKTPLQFDYSPRALKEVWCPHCKQWVTAKYLINRAATNFHFANGNIAYTCALLYALTGERKYADRAKEILLDYAAVAPTMKVFNPQATGYLNILTWAMLGESYAAHGYSAAYDFLKVGNYLTPEESRKIEDDFLLPMMKRMSMHNGTYSNQTAEYRSNQLAIALACDNWVMAGRAMNWDFGWNEMVKFGFDQDGWTIEGSTGYQLGCVVCMAPMADMAFYAGDDVYRGNEKFKKILELTGMHHLLFARYGEPYPNSAATNRYGLNDQTRAFYVSPQLPNEMIVAEAPKSVKSTIQDSAGYTFMRLGDPKTWNGVNVNWGQTWERSQSDLFSYKIFLRGERADGDSGRISYSNAHTGFTFTSLARSTIVVDEHNSSINRQFSCLVDGGEKFSGALVSTDPSRPLYKGVLITRYSVAIPEGVLLADVVDSDQPHNLDWPFYPPGKAQTNLTGFAAAKLVSDQPNAFYSVPFDLSAASTDGPLTMQYTVGKYQVRRTIAGGEPKQFVQGTAYGTWDGIPIPFTVLRKNNLAHSVNVEFYEAFDKTPALQNVTYSRQGDKLLVTLVFASGATKSFRFAPPRIASGKLDPSGKAQYISEIQ